MYNLIFAFKKGSSFIGLCVWVRSISHFGAIRIGSCLNRSRPRFRRSVFCKCIDPVCVSEWSALKTFDLIWWIISNFIVPIEANRSAFRYVLLIAIVVHVCFLLSVEVCIGWWLCSIRLHLGMVIETDNGMRSLLRCPALMEPAIACKPCDDKNEMFSTNSEDLNDCWWCNWRQLVWRYAYDSSELLCSVLQYCGFFSGTCVRSDSMTSPIA